MATKTMRISGTDASTGGGVISTSPAPAPAPYFTEAQLLEMGSIAPRGEGVDASFASPSATAATGGMRNVGNTSVQPYTGRSVIPEIGTYKGEGGQDVYKNLATSPISDAENVAIIQKNRGDYEQYQRDKQRNDILLNATDEWQRALNSATPGTKGYRSNKLKMASETLSAIRGMIGDSQAAETAKLNAEENRKFREEQLGQKAPTVLETDQGMVQYDPKTNTWKNTGMKPKPKEKAPADASEILKALADLAKPYTSMGQPVPPELQDVIDATLKEINGGKGSTIEKPPMAGAQKAPDGKWYVKDANGKIRPVIME